MQCPGQDSRYWDGAAIYDAQCPNCRTSVEFFKDDNSRKCGNCGHKVINPRIDFGCASYCPYAEQCLGELPPELLAKKQNLMIERAGIAVKKYFSTDFKKISTAVKIARYAEILAEQEECNKAMVIAAGYLLQIPFTDIGAILENLGAAEGFAAELKDLVHHFQARIPQDAIDYKVLADAVRLCAMEESNQAGQNQEETTKILQQLQTAAAKKAAARLV